MKLRIQQALVLVLVVIFNIGAVEAQPYEFQGHTYFLTSAGTWAEAEAEAVSHGGHLVSVNDAAEQDFINGMLSGSTWIGFTDEGSSSWEWVSGDPVTYENWSALEPNGGVSENCGVSEEAWGGLWNDLPCDRVLRGIVELEPDWALVDVTAGFERSSMGIAYDSDRGVVVVFGGRTDEAFSDTWEYDGSSWTLIDTANAPVARFWHSMVYDSNRQRMVLYGGLNADLGILFSDTWEYDGSDWQEVVTATSPPAMNSMSMAFDSHANKVVLFGGQGYAGEYNGTWEYDGTNWSQVITTASPPRGTLAAMAFDSVRNRVVFFGSGVVFDPSPSDTGTWEYDGVNWTEVITPTMPPGRWAHSIVYDSMHQRMVLFGGYGVSYPSGNQTNDTWVYDGFDWKQIFTDNIPPENEQHGMAYDSARNRVIMFGGWGGPGDTWEFIDEMSPAEQVDSTLNFIDYAVEAGTLEGSGSGNSANGRLGALINMIENVGSLVDDGFTSIACDQLLAASKKTDGQSRPKDFVTGPEAAELLQLILEMRDSFDCDQF
jgi:hypothetical protein